MSRTLAVHFLPILVESAVFRSSIAVVIDVLRASTTVVQALASGARGIIPCAEVEDTLALTARLPASTAVLGGERDGVRIPRFDLGNSPAEYTSERVAGKTVVFTTTNGTRALLHAGAARRIFLGSLVNVSAVADVISRESGPVQILCAGTRGHVTSEDVLCAGAIVEQLCRTEPNRFTLNDQAEIAQGFYSPHRGSPAGIHHVLAASLGGRDLLKLGFDADIQFAARIDAFDVVPEYLPRVGRIEPVPSGGTQTSS